MDVLRATATLALPSVLAAVVACGSAGRPTYASCGGSGDCEERSDECYALRFMRSDGSEADGNQCTRTCSSDVDCPGDGVCLSLEADPSGTELCFQPCIEPTDCFRHLRCTAVEGAAGIDSVCLP